MYLQPEKKSSVHLVRRRQSQYLGLSARCDGQSCENVK